jgi:hypothetical protein
VFTSCSVITRLLVSNALYSQASLVLPLYIPAGFTRSSLALQISSLCSAYHEPSVLSLPALVAVPFAVAYDADAADAATLCVLRLFALLLPELASSSDVPPTSSSSCNAVANIDPPSDAPSSPPKSSDTRSDASADSTFWRSVAGLIQSSNGSFTKTSMALRRASLLESRCIVPRAWTMVRRRSPVVSIGYTIAGGSMWQYKWWQYGWWQYVVV